MPAAKRSARVAPEVDLGNVHCFHLYKKANNSEPTLALKPIGDVSRNPKQGYQWSQKMNMCMPKTLKKQRKPLHLRKTPVAWFRHRCPLFTLLEINLCGPRLTATVNHHVYPLPTSDIDDIFPIHQILVEPCNNSTPRIRM